MVPLAVDPKTGFLETTGVHRFSAAMKMRALEFARENVQTKGELPNIPQTCAALGITHRTFYHHLALDSEFKSQWEEVLDLCEQELVSVMYANGKRPSGYMDRITWLRANRPQKWNPDFRLNISTDVTALKAVIDNANHAIDAQIVESPKELAGA
jgi:hypothetical protein